MLYQHLIIYAAPTSVQNALSTVVDNIVNVTWSPPSISNGIILQYIVKGIDSNDNYYFHVSGNKHYLEIPYFNNALVLVSAVNLYGQSEFEIARSSGKKYV